MFTGSLNFQEESNRDSIQTEQVDMERGDKGEIKSEEKEIYASTDK